MFTIADHNRTLSKIETAERRMPTRYHLQTGLELDKISLPEDGWNGK